MSWYIAGAYIGGWVIILTIFRYWYRQQKKKTDNLPPWFADNEATKAYYDIAKSDPENTKELQMRLMKRAMTTIARLWALSEEKNTLSRLTQSGAVSDDAWVRLKKAEKDLQLEIYDIEAEAESIKKGWGKTIMESSTQLVMLQRQQEAASKQKEYAEEWQKLGDTNDFGRIKDITEVLDEYNTSENSSYKNNSNSNNNSNNNRSSLEASASSKSNVSGDSDSSALSLKERQKIAERNARQLLAEEERKAAAAAKKKNAKK